MAFAAIEKVKEAELLARENIELAEKEAENRILAAKMQALETEKSASEKALADCSSKEDRARKKADEIMVTAHNTSLLTCEEIKRNSQKKQDAVNKKILKLISDI